MVRGSWPISGHPRPRSLIHGPRTRMSTDEPRASNQQSSTRSRRGFSRRAGSSNRSRRGFSRRAKTRTRTRRGFSRRAKTRTRNRRVLLSPRSTALIYSEEEALSVLFILTANEHIQTGSWVKNRGGSHYSCEDVSPVTHLLTCSLFYHLVINVRLI